jgi:hypothetical protein
MVQRDLSDLKFSGGEVSRLLIDFRLSADGRLFATVSIGTRFEFDDGNSRYTITPEASSELAPVLAIVRQRVPKSAVEASGLLRLDLTRGTIRVPPDSRYEAWEFHRLKEWSAICQPGGNVLTFPA